MGHNAPGTLACQPSLALLPCSCLRGPSFFSFVRRLQGLGFRAWQAHAVRLIHGSWHLHGVQCGSGATPIMLVTDSAPYGMQLGNASRWRVRAGGRCRWRRTLGASRRHAPGIPATSTPVVTTCFQPRCAPRPRYRPNGKPRQLTPSAAYRPTKAGCPTHVDGLRNCVARQPPANHASTGHSPT